MTNDKRMETHACDLISRQAAIKTAHLPVIDDAGYEVVRVDDILALPSAQPNLDEWCDDCKEYDQERHCCPRWNRVIRQTVEDMKTAQPEIIHCKDCKYNPNPPECGNAACVLFYGMTDQMGFCHHGERRERE